MTPTQAKVGRKTFHLTGRNLEQAQADTRGDPLANGQVKEKGRQCREEEQTLAMASLTRLECDSSVEGIDQNIHASKQKPISAPGTSWMFAPTTVTYSSTDCPALGGNTPGDPRAPLWSHPEHAHSL